LGRNEPTPIRPVTSAIFNEPDQMMRTPVSN